MILIFNKDTNILSSTQVSNKPKNDNLVNHCQTLSYRDSYLLACSKINFLVN